MKLRLRRTFVRLQLYAAVRHPEFISGSLVVRNKMVCQEMLKQVQHDVLFGLLLLLELLFFECQSQTGFSFASSVCWARLRVAEKIYRKARV